MTFVPSTKANICQITIGTMISVLDTGVRVSHQEFSDSAVPFLGMTTGDPLGCNGDLSCDKEVFDGKK